jgi:peptidoglycan/LPS O-acetylase OafA/YrhL
VDHPSVGPSPIRSEDRAEAAPRSLGHIDSLDGLRGLAAGIVLIGHVNVSLEKPLEVLNLIRHGPLAVLINGYGRCTSSSS